MLELGFLPGIKWVCVAAPGTHAKRLGKLDLEMELRECSFAQLAQLAKAMKRNGRAGG